MKREEAPRTAAADALAQRLRAARRRASVGRALVALAVFAPALLIVLGFLLSRGSIYGHRLSGPKWPWIAADVALLACGTRLMRGEDL